MVGKVKACTYPDNTESAGLLERYRENWGLLKFLTYICTFKVSNKPKSLTLLAGRVSLASGPENEAAYAVFIRASEFRKL